MSLEGKFEFTSYEPRGGDGWQDSVRSVGEQWQRDRKYNERFGNKEERQPLDAGELAEELVKARGDMRAGATWDSEKRAYIGDDDGLPRDWAHLVSYLRNNPDAMKTAQDVLNKLRSQNTETQNTPAAAPTPAPAHIPSIMRPKVEENQSNLPGIMQKRDKLYRDAYGITYTEKPQFVIEAEEKVAKDYPAPEQTPIPDPVGSQSAPIESQPASADPNQTPIESQPASAEPGSSATNHEDDPAKVEADKSIEARRKKAVSVLCGNALTRKWLERDNIPFSYFEKEDIRIIDNRFEAYRNNFIRIIMNNEITFKAIASMNLTIKDLETMPFEKLLAMEFDDGSGPDDDNDPDGGGGKKAESDNSGEFESGNTSEKPPVSESGAKKDAEDGGFESVIDLGPLGKQVSRVEFTSEQIDAHERNEIDSYKIKKAVEVWNSATDEERRSFMDGSWDGLSIDDMLSGKKGKEDTRGLYDAMRVLMDYGYIGPIANVAEIRNDPNITAKALKKKKKIELKGGIAASSSVQTREKANGYKTKNNTESILVSDKRIEELSGRKPSKNELRTIRNCIYAWNDANPVSRSKMLADKFEGITGNDKRDKWLAGAFSLLRDYKIIGEPDVKSEKSNKYAVKGELSGDSGNYTASFDPEVVKKSIEQEDKILKYDELMATNPPMNVLELIDRGIKAMKEYSNYVFKDPFGRPIYGYHRDNKTGRFIYDHEPKVEETIEAQEEPVQQEEAAEQANTEIVQEEGQPRTAAPEAEQVPALITPITSENDPRAITFTEDALKEFNPALDNPANMKEAEDALEGWNAMSPAQRTELLTNVFTPATIAGSFERRGYFEALKKYGLINIKVTPKNSNSSENTEAA